MELIGLAFGVPFLLIGIMLFARQFARRQLRRAFGEKVVQFQPSKKRRKRAA